MQANAPASQYIQVNRKTANIPLIKKPVKLFSFSKQVASDMQTAQPYFDQSQQQQGYYNQVSRIFFSRLIRVQYEADLQLDFDNLRRLDRSIIHYPLENELNFSSSTSSPSRDNQCLSNRRRTDTSRTVGTSTQGMMGGR